MTTSPRLSVIVPAKDAESYIAESLTSLTLQGLPPEDMEVVVIDDGSEDHTAEIAGRFADRFGAFRLLRNPQPTGVSAARNAGMRAATGTGITFLDSDDWYADGHLAAMLEAFERLEVDSVRTDIILAAGKHRTLKSAPVYLRNRRLRTADHTVRGFDQTMVDYPNPPTGLYHRRLLERGLLYFDESLRSAEDREWNWRIMLRSETFAVVTTPGAYYRRGVGGSLTAVYNETQLDFIRSCEKTLALTRELSGGTEGDPRTLKAAHNLFALADIHLQRRAEMTKGLRMQLVSELTRVAEGLSEAELATLVDTFSRKRRDHLRPVLRALSRRKAARSSGGTRAPQNLRTPQSFTTPQNLRAPHNPRTTGRTMP